MSAPGTPGGELFRRYWQPVALASKLGDVPLPVRILGEDLVVFRDLEGRVGVLHRHCCHRGASLEFGVVSQRGIRCCYHGWLFDVDGGDPRNPGRAAREPHPPHRLARSVPGTRVRRPRLRLHGTARGHASVPVLRYLRAARQPPDPLLALAPVQLAAASREHDGPGARGVPAHPGGGGAAHRSLGRDAGVRLPPDPERHDVHHRQALGRLRLDPVQPHHPAELRPHRGAVGGWGRGAPVHPGLGHALDGADRRHPHRGPGGAALQSERRPQGLRQRGGGGRRRHRLHGPDREPALRGTPARPRRPGTRRCRSARSPFMRSSIGARRTRG